MTIKSSILVFAKTPDPGLVKTRLIPFIGKQKAAELHSAMVVQSVSIAALSQNQHRDLQLWCAPNTSHPLFYRLQRDYALSLNQQLGDDLGIRMYQAFYQALMDHDQVVIIGTDCPSLTAELIEQAFHALTTNDAVIVPAEDGGYVLLGLKKASLELFTGITWGTDHVYTQTVERFQQLGLTWEELPWQWDVDRPVDLERLVRVYHHSNLHPDLWSVIAGLNITEKESRAVVGEKEK